MHNITAHQIRAARSFLGWTQRELEEASGVGLSAIGDFEDGSSPRRDTVVKLCTAFEKNGVEFTPDGGIKPRSNRYNIIIGADSCEKLFNDMLETVKPHGGEVMAFLESNGMLNRPRGVNRRSILERLTLVHQIAPVRCLVAEPLKLSGNVTPFPIRAANKGDRPGTFCFFVYGDCYVMIMENRMMDVDFIIVHGDSIADAMRAGFMAVWDR